jgi:hypothetical protein
VTAKKAQPGNVHHDKARGSNDLIQRSPRDRQCFPLALALMTIIALRQLRDFVSLR